MNNLISQKNIIAIDIDDTLTTYKRQGTLLKKVFPTKIGNYDPIKHGGWNTFNFSADPINSITLDDEIKFWDDYSEKLFSTDIKNPLWNKLGPVVLQNNPRIVIITARPSQYREITEKWLAKNNVKYDDLLMTSLGSKIPAIKQTGTEVVIDDKPDLFLSVTKEFKNSLTRIIIDKPYNRNLNKDCYDYRIGDFTGNLMEG